jgi:AmmeMemoRadiSam system protein B/AmmeMemoRadiSam system protein A
MAPVLAHHSPLAGSWYPRGVSELKGLLSAALENSIGRTGPFVRQGGLAFVVPHAAPAYSGVVAASVYRHVQAYGVKRVVILGFSHRHPIQGIAVPDVDCIETPFGAIRIDRETADSLTASPPFHSVPEEATCDHSVEIQIPFLQTFVPHATLVPLYVGRLTGEQRCAAAHALRGLIDAHTVLIASSDLTHYGPDFGYMPFPLDASTPEKLRVLDNAAIAASGSLDPALFIDELNRTGATVCGADPIRLLLETLGGLHGEIFQETLDYATSGAITHDYEHSVSYGALGYFPAVAYQLHPPDQAALLEGARYTLDHYRRTGETRYPQPLAESALLQRGRAFVTLYDAKGALRGCTGRLDNCQTLAECVSRVAIAAAYDDDRFPPVAPDEELEIEVHVLTPLKRIADPRVLIAGEHGACLKWGAHRGLLLPAVATRYHLSREQFLQALTQKTGVPDNVYASAGWELEIFRDQSFRERPI